MKRMQLAIVWLLSVILIVQPMSAVALTADMDSVESVVSSSGDFASGEDSATGDASGEGENSATGDASGDVADLSGEAVDSSGDDASGDVEKEAYVGVQAPEPQLLFRSAISLWVNGAGVDGVEYGIRVAGTQGAFDWQDTTLFFGLAPHTSYELAIRYKETETVAAGGIATYITDTDDWLYSIRYHCKGGQNVTSNVKAYQVCADSLELCSPTRAGYQFVGWYQDSACTKKVKRVSLTSALNVHLYAKWKKVSVAKISGVKFKKKGSSALSIHFNKSATAWKYQIQYGTSAKFAKKATVTRLVAANTWTTPKLASGTTYYARVRSVSYDSCGNRLYGAYSATVKATTAKVPQIQSGGARKGAVSADAAKKSKTKKTAAKTTQNTKSQTSAETTTKKAAAEVTVVNHNVTYLSVKDTKQLKLPPQIKVEEITDVSGEAAQIAAAKRNKLVVKSSKPAVAAVSATGVITAKKVGKTTITLRRGNQKYVYPVIVEKVSLSQKNMKLVVGNQKTLTLEDAVSKPKWTSGKQAVVSVSKNGVVTGIAPGTAQVQATYHGHTYTCNVTVISVEQNNIEKTTDFYFGSTRHAMTIGEQYVIPYTVSPAGRGADQIAWYSTNPSVATVVNGVVTAFAAGVTTIQVKYQTSVASMRIQVLENADVKSLISVTAHRGGSDAPENTLPAFVDAKNKGFQTVEVDVRWTKDNVPILLHDSTVGRTSDATLDAAVQSLTYEECIALDFGSKFGEKYKDTKIVRLDDYLSCCKNLGLRCYIEIKEAIYREQCQLLAQLIRYYGMEANTTIISFSSNSLQSMQEIMPNMRFGYLCNKVTKANIEVVEELRTSGSDAFMDVKYTAPLSNASLRKLGNAGIDWECWTVNSLELMQQGIAQGASGFTTDSVTLLDYYK
jgi:uncharacterized repeat protein (TIGR02543 family)